MAPICLNYHWSLPTQHNRAEMLNELFLEVLVQNDKQPSVLPSINFDKKCYYIYGFVFKKIKVYYSNFQTPHN